MNILIYRLRKSLIIILMLFSISKLYSQDSSISINILDENNINWWNNNNNYGLDTSQSYINYRAGIFNSKTAFSGNFFLTPNHKKVLHIGELYFSLKLKDNFSIKAGRYYRDFSQYLNDDLSSGSLLFSKNAQAMPKIGLIFKKKLKRLKNFNYELGFTNGLFDTNQFYSSSPFLHEKFAYLNFENKINSFGIGFVHEAMWGGTTTQGMGSGKQPSTFRDFLKVIISADGPWLEGEPHPNALGNHLGIWDFYFIKKLENTNIKFYYQHFFEDTSSLRFANRFDGLWGVEIYNSSKKSNFLIEYLDTSNCCIDPPYQSDNYYWNYQYKSGWRYKGDIIGNPYINPQNSYFSEQIKLLHIGLSGKFYNDTYYKMIASRKINENDKAKFGLFLTKKVFNNISLKLSLLNEKSVRSTQIGLIYHLNEN